MRPSVSTGTGDDGSTGLYGGGRTKKSALRIHALGTIDELNAILGVAMAESAMPAALRSALEKVQRSLFMAGADIAWDGHLRCPSHDPTLPSVVALHAGKARLRAYSHSFGAQQHANSGERNTALKNQAFLGCCPMGEKGYRLSSVFIGELERWGVAMEQELPSLSRFILPGGSKVSALLHHARAVCRRAERWVVSFAQEEAVNAEVQVYLNRLSDCLFLAARRANQDAGQDEVQV